MSRLVLILAAVLFGWQGALICFALLWYVNVRTTRRATKNGCLGYDRQGGKMNIGTMLFGIAAWGSWFALTWMFLLDVIPPTPMALIVWTLWLLLAVGVAAMSKGE